MVIGAPHKLKQWWRNIRRENVDEIGTHLGALTSLMNIRADMILTRLVIEVWYPTKAVFKFVDYELTSTLEEFTSFTELPFMGRKPILLVVMPDHMFLHTLCLTSNMNLRNDKDEWVSLDQLFDGFVHRESYEWHKEEF